MTRVAGCVAAGFIAREAFASTRRRCAPATPSAILSHPVVGGLAHSGRDEMLAFAQNRIDA
ncbi:hypothetical protein DIE04_23460 [Burkholderia sp. Bp8994]|nr:hypothetical protein DIE04_23460 [Burkholderia sp. Bp8994]RQS48776.1 hypothetical protein DIE00_09985 [Burkholderia sp. Bp8989]RQS60792.1 hypothetical protein DID98_12750 [Burkholderia sp. Bp8984]